MSIDVADSLSSRERLDRACAELRRRLHSGQECRAEEYLVADPLLASSEECAVVLIVTEFVVRRQAGANPQPGRAGRPLSAPGASDCARRSATRRTAARSPTPNAPCRWCQAGRRRATARGRGALRPLRVARSAGPRRHGGGLSRLGRTTRPHGRPEDDSRWRPGTPKMLTRFEREARAAAQLRHPNIVPLYEFGQHQGYRYFTMPLALGGSLYTQTQRYREPRDAAALVARIARAVQHAHEHGVIHRDLKPSNVLLDEEQQPLVADFGLAKLDTGDEQLTYSGERLGTLAYMAPEQAARRAHEATPHTDVWSLGVILYELTTGRRPFVSAHPERLPKMILTADPRPPRSLRREIDRGLEAIILKCLEKDPQRRYASAAALADDLDHWLAGELVAAPPVSVWRRLKQRRVAPATALGIVVLIAVALGAFLWFGPRGKPPDARQRFRDGETVELIGATGGPVDSEWVVLKGSEVPLPDRDGTFTINAVRPTVLRLMRAPGRSFRLSAMVRHNEGSARNLGPALASARGGSGLPSVTVRRTSTVSPYTCISVGSSTIVAWIP